MVGIAAITNLPLRDGPEFSIRSFVCFVRDFTLFSCHALGQIGLGSSGTTSRVLNGRFSSRTAGLSQNSDFVFNGVHDEHLEERWSVSSHRSGSICATTL